MALCRAFRDFVIGRDMAWGAYAAIGTVSLQVLWKLISEEDWRLHKWRWVASVTLPFLFIVIGHTAWRLLTAPWRLHQDHEKEYQEKETKLLNEVQTERTIRLDAEQRLKELTGSKQRKAEWEKLGERFKGYPSSIQACWQQVLPADDHHFSWFLLGGKDERQGLELGVVMEEAGKLLLTSQHVSENFSWLRGEAIPEYRWLNFVRENVRDAKKVTGTGVNHSVHYESGAIYEIVENCIYLCTLLAAKEKWPLSDAGTNLPRYAPVSVEGT
jgi:hypothetical protein